MKGPGRACLTCCHPERDVIDRRLLGGEHTTVLGPEYGLSKSGLVRHRAKHLPAELAKAAKAAEVARADNLVELVLDTINSVRHVLRTAEDGYLKTLGYTPKGDVVTAQVQDHGLVLEAADRMERLAALLLKVQGALPSGDTVNVFVSAEWAQLRTVIMAALAPFPDARLAVASALAGQAQPALSAPQLLSIPLSQPVDGADAEHEISVLTGDSGGYGDRTAPPEAQ